MTTSIDMVRALVSQLSPQAADEANRLLNVLEEQFAGEKSLRLKLEAAVVAAENMLPSARMAATRVHGLADVMNMQRLNISVSDRTPTAQDVDDVRETAHTLNRHLYAFENSVAALAQVKQSRPIMPPDTVRGLYTKYLVERVDGSSMPGGKHHKCFYYVLDTDHDPFAIPALQAYANACRDKYPKLAADLDALITQKTAPASP